MKSLGSILKQSSYSQLLSTDEWRNFASSVRQRKGNFCQMCKRGGLITQVHHVFYESTRSITDYQDDELMVLCEGCHKDVHEQLRAFRKHVFGKMNAASFKILNGALAVAFEMYDPLVFSHALAEFVGNQGLVENHAKAWKMTALKRP
jgi:hypothetical protein